MLAHLLVGSLLAVTIRAAKSRRIFALSCLLQFAMCSAYAVLLLPFCCGSIDQTATGEHKLLYANVYRSNPTPQLLAALIERIQPDIVALTEYYPDLDPILKLETKYAYSVRQVQDGCFGMVIYSKYPIAANPTVSLGGNLPPAIIAALNLGAPDALTLSLTHTQPPLSQEAIYNNTLIMRRLAQRMRHVEEPVIAVGDFNATPFSWFYQGFLSITNLHDASAGFGLRKTWNVDNWLLWFIIDHIFVNDRIVVQQVERLEAIGSDHYPLLIRFGLR